VALDQFVSAFDRATRRARTRQLFAGLASAFGPSSVALNDSLGYAAPVSANARDVLVAARRPEQRPEAA